MTVTEVFETLTHINIVREHIVGLPLFTSFVEKKQYTENNVGDFVKQMIEGVRYLHEHNIVHGNLKSENIIIQSLDNGTSLVKICDHLQSTIMNYDIYRLAILAIPSTCPPEVLLSQLRTKAIDMWAVGICTFILLYGYEPFYQDKETEMFRAIITAKYKLEEHCNLTTNASKDFINKLLLVNPEDRMTIVEALKHPWLDISVMKNQPLSVTYDTFKRSVEAYHSRLEEKVMYDIRRACQIFEKLILRNTPRIY